VNQLVEIIKKEIPSTASVSIQERDIDNIRRRSLDIEKLHQKVGFSPKYNIQNGIKLTLDYMRKKDTK
jgi:nucleoside-diphosphate-sugar epimerase